MLTDPAFQLALCPMGHFGVGVIFLCSSYFPGWWKHRCKICYKEEAIRSGKQHGPNCHRERDKKKCRVVLSQATMVLQYAEFPETVN